jgi:hypothetical protein
MSEYKASCFCGGVELSLTGAPVAMGYCHCESCRRWSAGPINAFSLWKPDTVKITKGADNIGTYNKTPNSFRKWCKTCGGHLMTDHPPFGLIDVYASVIDGFKFEPGVHLFYEEKFMPIRDGVAKQKDIPKEMGGSGTILPE